MARLATIRKKQKTTPRSIMQTFFMEILEKEEEI